MFARLLLLFFMRLRCVQQASGTIVISMLARLALYLEITADEDCLPDVPIVGTPAEITAATAVRREAERQLPILREAVHSVLLLHHSVQLDVSEAQMYQQIVFMQVCTLCCLVPVKHC